MTVRGLRVAYRAYAAIFAISGLASVLFARAELSAWFGVGDPPASLLNQYRFLRAAEVGFGALLWTNEDAFFASGRVRSAILGAFVLIPAARTVSMLVDGRPQRELIGLCVAEYAIFAVFALAAPATRENDA